MLPNLIEVNRLQIYLGGAWVLKDINFSIQRNEIIAIVGGSGSGKTTVLRNILGLLTPTGGSVKLFGRNIQQVSLTELGQLQRRTGVLFQQGALFSSLSVLENIIFPLKEFTKLSKHTREQIALLKLGLVGLGPKDANKYPSELSGGMQKRVALARAIAMDPELLFLDEPSSGLDPVSAAEQDDLLLQLQKSLGLTIVMVTHDVNTLASIVTRIIFLGKGQVLASGTYKELMQNDIPEVKTYFHSTRSQRVMAEE